MDTSLPDSCGNGPSRFLGRVLIDGEHERYQPLATSRLRLATSFKRRSQLSIRQR